MKKSLAIMFLALVLITPSFLLGCTNVDNTTNNITNDSSTTNTNKNNSKNSTNKNDTTANNNSLNEKDILQTVWEQLSDSEQDEIIGNWKDGTIDKIVVEKDSGRFLLLDKSLYGKEVYLVTFKSEKEPLLGNVEKLVHMDTYKIVGTSYRD